MTTIKRELIRVIFIIVGGWGIYTFLIELLNNYGVLDKLGWIIYPIIMLSGLIIKVKPSDSKFIHLLKKTGSLALILGGGWGIFFVVLDRLSNIPFYKSYSVLIHVMLILIGVFWLEQDGEKL